MEFAQGSLVRLFAGIDAALRHLPGISVGARIGLGTTPADEDQTVFVDQHDTDTGAIGQIFSGL
jgi:hypothetical protein